VTAETFDYVIVGAGSAGCVLADRLSESGKDSVLLLEYGGSDRALWIQMPSALNIPLNMERYDWRYYTEPEPNLNNRRLHTPRGKVLGGSSSINGLVYVRGNPLDFERWESEGAAGWRYQRGEVAHEARARREVILCAGAINSPQLLKLSGVGPRNELGALGIAVVQELAGVGENLQDHMEFYFQVASRVPITLYKHMSLWRRGLIGARWLLTHDGLGASNQFEAGGFIRSRAGVRYPDIQFHFLPLAVSYDGSSLAKEHGFQAHVGPMRSRSTGWVRLRSTAATERPMIFFNYLSQPDDWVEMRACVRLTREIFAQPAFASYRAREIQPGEQVRSDEEIDGFIRAKAESAFHPSCTCKMGRTSDPMAVVDNEARVIGVEALRVVDSSIMPSITTGNLNAPTIMLAEKAADHIRGKPLLPRASAPYYIAPDWKNRQR